MGKNHRHFNDTKPDRILIMSCGFAVLVCKNIFVKALYGDNKWTMIARPKLTSERSIMNNIVSF